MRSVAPQVFRSKVDFFIDTFRKATKTDHGYRVLDVHPLSTEPGRVVRIKFNNDEVENFARARESKEVNHDLNPSGYIMRME